MSSADANKLLALTNQHRASIGLNALQLDGKLTAAAEGHSVTQAQTKTMSHNGFENRVATCGFPGIVWAENVGMSENKPIDVAEMHQNWLNSQGHRENIEKVGLTHVGFGLASNGNLLYYTEFFAGQSSGSNYSGAKPQSQQPSSYQGSPSNGHRALSDNFAGNNGGSAANNSPASNSEPTGNNMPVTNSAPAGDNIPMKGIRPKQSKSRGSGIPQVQNQNVPNSSEENVPSFQGNSSGNQAMPSMPSMDAFFGNIFGGLMNGQQPNSQTQYSSDPNAHQTQYSSDPNTKQTQSKGNGSPTSGSQPFNLPGPNNLQSNCAKGAPSNGNPVVSRGGLPEGAGSMLPGFQMPNMFGH
ncbi:hypothetical protein ROZALSC1DRAFT_23154 [Rozella allomycis CSF55]|uniref:SCP domain-containing protein n=1 Tax=Rozella allomycis (strain CSF55) TaxID=988480 RepID=A0A4V1IZL9_ROZAC|nr:hypothetical protein ROZALSC1DRAFT_23154 [Rozella allomycis CSF55]